MSFYHTCYLLLSQIAKETRRFEDKVYYYYFIIIIIIMN